MELTALFRADFDTPVNRARRVAAVFELLRSDADSAHEGRGNVEIVDEVLTDGFSPLLGQAPVQGLRTRDVGMSDEYYGIARGLVAFEDRTETCKQLLGRFAESSGAGRKGYARRQRENLAGNDLATGKAGFCRFCAIRGGRRLGKQSVFDHLGSNVFVDFDDIASCFGSEGRPKG